MANKFQYTNQKELRKGHYGSFVTSVVSTTLARRQSSTLT